MVWWKEEEGPNVNGPPKANITSFHFFVFLTFPWTTPVKRQPQTKTFSTCSSCHKQNAHVMRTSTIWISLRGRWLITETLYSDMPILFSASKYAVSSQLKSLKHTQVSLTVFIRLHNLRFSNKIWHSLYWFVHTKVCERDPMLQVSSFFSTQTLVR